jgi:hypothetical protein
VLEIMFLIAALRRHRALAARRQTGMADLGVL